jgi:hypothetical protein
MEHLEIIAKLADLGAIGNDRKQKIGLEDVAHLYGSYNLKGNPVKIYICDPKTAEIIDSVLKNHKKKP